MKTGILLLSISVFVNASMAGNVTTPMDPMWPTVWSSDFTEIHNIIGLEFLGRGNNTGTWYYDMETGRQRIDRSNGRYDTLCGVNGMKLFEDTPCSQYVVNGTRWLYYPEKDECCNCCSGGGCGMIKNTWLNGAEFLGEVQYNNQTVYKWDQVAGTNNYYYETIETDPLNRVMVRLNQAGSDDMAFPGGRIDAVPEGALDLPEACSSNEKCAYLSACRFIWLD